MAGISADHGNARATVALAAGVALGVAHALPALAKPVPGVRALLGIGTGTRSGAGVALTFDDGPHPEGTAAILETLRDWKVPATFFLVGEQVARAPPLAAEVAAAGHGIALHCNRHRNMLRLTPWQVRDDLDRALERIVSATGIEPELHRAPYGVYSLAGLLLARQRALRPLLWTHWGRDWSARATPSTIARRATADLRPGSVLLLHDADTYSSPGSWRRTAAALPRVLEAIEAAGLAHVEP
jgi:peptidoglycan/xylan/chitin deacetylase (PgdA/CDA1 family)